MAVSPGGFRRPARPSIIGVVQNLHLSTRGACDENSADNLTHFDGSARYDPSCLGGRCASRNPKKRPRPSILNDEMETLDGEKVNLAKKYKGKVVLLVNVASKCGNTPQYKPLEALARKIW